MFAHATDRDWELLGDTDPYWAVLTDDQFHTDQLDADAIERFYQSGQSYVDLIFGLIRQYVDPAFTPTSGLDFGCGVGRLAIPLAMRVQQVVGVDISEGMLSKARERANQLHVTNAAFVRSDDQLSMVCSSFDFVHSFIVLQHIPSIRGYKICQRLVELIANGGVGALHVTFGRPAQPKMSWLRLARRHVITVLDVMRPLIGRLLQPKMQMNSYDLNAVIGWIQDAGARRIHIELTDHGGCRGAMLIFQKRPDEPFAI